MGDIIKFPRKRKPSAPAQPGSVHSAITGRRGYRLIPDGRKRQRRCSYCPRESSNKATHVGLADGAAMTSGCEWHMLTWVREPKRGRNAR